MEQKEKIGAILLAAGSSRRFGQNKLLYQMDGKPMVQRTMELLLQCQVSKCVIVTGHEEVTRLAETLGIQAVKNDQPHLGISHSLQLGMKALKEMDGWMFLVCDQPWLKVESIEGLLALWKYGEKNIAALACEGEPGNPVLFSKSYEEELVALKGDRGGKQILLRNMEDVALFEVEKCQLRDVDTPQIWED